MPSQVRLDVCVYVFDLLYLNGTTLLGLPLRERRGLLPSALPHARAGRMEPATGREFRLLAPETEQGAEAGEVQEGGGGGAQGGDQATGQTGTVGTGGVESGGVGGSSLQPDQRAPAPATVTAFAVTAPDLAVAAVAETQPAVAAAAPGPGNNPFSVLTSPQVAAAHEVTPGQCEGALMSLLLEAVDAGTEGE